MAEKFKKWVAVKRMPIPVSASLEGLGEAEGKRSW